MKLKNILLFASFFVLFNVFTDVSFAQRKTQKSNTKPEIRQDESISTSYDKTKDETTVNLKYTPVVSGNNQSFFIGAAYSDKDSDSAVLSIYSISKKYRYEEYSDVKILVDGEKLSYTGERLARLIDNREASVDENGNAVEILSVLLSVSELKSIASARRVDITVWTDSFILNPKNLNLLREFAAKVEPLNTKAQVKKPNNKLNSVSASDVSDLPKCALTIEQSPEIKGFRLGMSAQDIISKFDNRYSSVNGNKVNMDGVNVVVYAYYNFGSGGNLPKTEEWESVEYIRFQFLDDKLFTFEIHYNNKQLKLWKDTESFIKVLSERMTLPTQLVSGKSSEKYDFKTSKYAYCNGWTMELKGDALTGEIKIINSAAKTAYLKNVEEKKRLEEEKKQKSFKP